jgi:hypothetical protein
MSARTQKKSNVLSQDEHSHSLPLLRDWLNDITCKPITSHSSSRDASKQNRTVRGEIERPKTTTDLSTLKISPLSNHLLISNSISPSTTRLQPLQGKQSSSSSSMIEVNQSVQHPLMDKLLVFSNVHKELTRQAAFHCPSLANLLHRSWSGVSSLASTAVVKLYDAEAKYRLTDSRCERLTSDMSLNLEAIVSERNLLRSENQKLQGQCDNHESDALRHRKELALAQLDADTAHFRLEKTASAALSGSARILSKRLEKEKGAETIKVKKNDDNEHEVNAVTSRGILELTLLFSELEKERAQQKSLAEELKAYVGSTALTIMLQNQWWLPKPSRSVGVQWVDDPPPPPPPIQVLPVVDNGPYILPILAKKRPNHVDLPFEIRILLKTFSFTNGPRLFGLGQAKRLILQLLLDKAIVDKASLPLQGMRASFASCTVEYFSQKFGLAQLSDLRVIEIVIAIRAHAHHHRRQQQQPQRKNTLAETMSKNLGGTINLAGTMTVPPQSDHAAIIPFNARGGGDPDLLMRMSDLYVGASSIRDDGRPWLQQGPLDAIVTFLDELRLSKELIRDRVTGTGDITPGELEGTFPVSRSVALSAAKEALAPFLLPNIVFENHSSAIAYESFSSTLALVESIAQIRPFHEAEGGIDPLNDHLLLQNTSTDGGLSVMPSITLPSPPAESSIMFGEDRVDVSHGMRVVILHWSLEQCDWEVRISSAFDSCSTRGLPYTSERSKEMSPLTSSTSSSLSTVENTEMASNMSVQTIDFNTVHVTEEQTKVKKTSVGKNNDNKYSLYGKKNFHSPPNQSRYSRPFVRLPPAPLKSKRSSSSSSLSSSAQGGRKLLPGDKLWQPPATLYKSSKKSGALSFSLEKKRESESLEKRRKSVESITLNSTLISFAAGNTVPINATQTQKTLGESNIGSTGSSPSRQRRLLRFSSTPVFRPEDLFMVDVDAFADARYTRKGSSREGPEKEMNAVTGSAKAVVSMTREDAYADKKTNELQSVHRGKGEGKDNIDDDEEEDDEGGAAGVGNNNIAHKEGEDESTAIDTLYLHHTLSSIESPVPSSQLLSSQALQAIATALLDDDDDDYNKGNIGNKKLAGGSGSSSSSSKIDVEDNRERDEDVNSRQQGRNGNHHHHLTTTELLSSSAAVGRIRRANVYANRRRRHSVPTRGTQIPTISSSSSHHPQSHRSQSSSIGGFSANDSHYSANWPSGSGSASALLMRRRSSTSTMTGLTIDDGDTIVEEDGDSQSTTRTSINTNDDAEGGADTAVRSASASTSSFPPLPPNRSSSLLLSRTLPLRTSSSSPLRNRVTHSSHKHTKNYALGDLTALANRLATDRSLLNSSNRSRRKITLPFAISTLTKRDPSIDSAIVTKAFEHARWRLEEAAHNVKVAGWVRTVIPEGALEEMIREGTLDAGGRGGGGGGGGRPTSPLNLRKLNGMHSSLLPNVDKAGGGRGGLASRSRPRHFFWRNPRTGQISLTCPEIERERVRELDYTSFAEMCLRHGFLRNDSSDASAGKRGRGGREFIGDEDEEEDAVMEGEGISSSKAIRRLIMQEHLSSANSIQSWWRRWSWIRNLPRRAREKAEKVAFDAKRDAEMLLAEADRAIKLAHDAEILQQQIKAQEEEEEKEKAERTNKVNSDDDIDDVNRIFKTKSGAILASGSVSAHNSTLSSRTNNSHVSSSTFGGGGGRRGSVEQMISNARLRIAQREAVRKHEEAMRAEAIASAALEEAYAARANSLRVDEVRSLLQQSKRSASHRRNSPIDDSSLSIGIESSTSVALRALRQFGKRFSFSKAYSPSPPPFLHDTNTPTTNTNTLSNQMVDVGISTATTSQTEIRRVNPLTLTMNTQQARKETDKIGTLTSSSSSSSISSLSVPDAVAVSHRVDMTSAADALLLPSSSTFLSELEKLEAQELMWDSLTPRSRNSILLQVKRRKTK